MISHVRKTVVIRRPLASVFDFILNGANNRLWKSSVLEVQPLGAPPYGPGSKFQQEVQGPEGPVSGDYQITQVKTNALIEYEMMSGPRRWAGTYRFASEHGETAVTLELAAGREGLVQTTAAMQQRLMEDEARTLDDLKAFLEKHV